MLEIPLLINGGSIRRDPSPAGAPFYPSYTYRVSEARLLDLATAIGLARQATRPSPPQAAEILERAAAAFEPSEQIIAHTVRLTGAPLSVVRGLLAEIPAWLRETPAHYTARFTALESPALRQALAPGSARLLLPADGLAYAITPGNDPRAAALAAANLVYLGLPFILRASRKDAVAPLVIQALLQAGLEPGFASLVYFDPQQAPGKHFHLLEACQIVWTFGPDEHVDARLRYETTGQQAIIDLPQTRFPGGEPLDVEAILGHARRYGLRVEAAHRDGFAGKVVLRHNSGNCAALTSQPWGAEAPEWLYPALSFPHGCTVTKTVFTIDQPSWEKRLADWLASLIVGDPLAERTQVGYIDPRLLEALEQISTRHARDVRLYGGERLAPHQARPRLLVTQADLPDLLGQEIPAYTLNLRPCASLDEALLLANRYSEFRPRLAVSLHGLPEATFWSSAARLRAHTVLDGLPTSRTLPTWHEGNDYATSLSHNRLVLRQGIRT